MSFSYGNCIKIQLGGGSHEAAVSVSVEGIPAGTAIDLAAVQAMLDRRAPGRSELSTERKEADIPEILSGIANGIATGEVIAARFVNSDIRPQDYERFIPRPSHGDYTAWVKAGGEGPIPSGGATSARMTVGLVFAGAICAQLLEKHGITIRAEAKLPQAAARAPEGDSFGGFVRCIAEGLPVGLGESYFGGLESRISEAVFAIPAVKGIEFGAGFASAEMLGSEYNDAFYYDLDGNVKTRTNHCGGILGGMADGMPLVFRAVFKPTPSIGLEQDSVDLKTKQNVRLTVRGRHDKCLVPRAAVVVEAVTAIVLLDMMTEEGRIEWKNSEND